MKRLFRLSLILYSLTWLTACGESAIATPQKEG
jgi:predicted small lipoprotein YifL